MERVRAHARAWGIELLGLMLVAPVFAAVLVVYAPVRVDGASMAPALEFGDIVLVRRGAPAKAGEIALFRLDGDSKPTLHRVQAETGGGLVTSGDANPVSDRRCVPRSRVLGRVDWVLPFGRAIALARARVHAGGA